MLQLHGNDFARGVREEIFSVTVPFLAIFKRTFTDSLTTVCILPVFYVHFYRPLPRVLAYKNLPLYL